MQWVYLKETLHMLVEKICYVPVYSLFIYEKVYFYKNVLDYEERPEWQTVTSVSSQGFFD